MNSFNSLMLTEKALLVAEYADYIMTVEYELWNFHLLSIHSDLIEVCYNKLSLQVESIRTIDYKALDRYLHKIETNI